MFASCNAAAFRCLRKNVHRNNGDIVLLWSRNYGGGGGSGISTRSWATLSSFSSSASWSLSSQERVIPNQAIHHHQQQQYKRFLNHLTERSDISITIPSAPTSVASRTYISRAHCKPRPEFPINEALQILLDDIQERRDRRETKYRRNNPNEKPKDDDGDSNQEEAPTEASSEAPVTEKEEKKITYARDHPDETIELALNLNLDPRKPGQSLRGNIALPHGSGKRIGCIVFTSDERAQRAAVEAGALHAGGSDLVTRVADGDAPLDAVERSLATSDMMPALSKKVARLLGPRGLMPNVKAGTLVESPDELIQKLDVHLSGKEVPYRTERSGIVHVPVGKGSFGVDKILDNVGQVMKDIIEAKPESYGKGRKAKSGKNPKYLLRASVSSTQGPGIRVDLRTVDPTSAFFVTSVEAASQRGRGGNATADNHTTERAAA